MGEAGGGRDRDRIEEENAETGSWTRGAFEGWHGNLMQWKHHEYRNVVYLHNALLLSF